MESVLHAFIMIPICFMIFYRGYRAVAFDNTMFKTYLYTELPITLFYCFHMKYETLCYNGLDKVWDKFSQPKTLSFWLIIVDNVFLALSIWMRLSCILMAIQWRTRDTY